MSRTAIFVLSLIMLSGMVQISLVSSELADTPWPKFRHDLQNTGRIPYVGAQENTLKWSYTTDGGVYSSPAIGSDGTVYVGSNGNKFYAINPDGTFKWSYSTNFDVASSPAIGADGTIYFGSDDGNLYTIYAPPTEAPLDVLLIMAMIVIVGLAIFYLWVRRR